MGSSFERWLNRHSRTKFVPPGKLVVKEGAALADAPASPRAARSRTMRSARLTYSTEGSALAHDFPGGERRPAGRGYSAAGSSGLGRVRSTRAVHVGSHQFQRPRSIIDDGTRSARM